MEVEGWQVPAPVPCTGLLVQAWKPVGRYPTKGATGVCMWLCWACALWHTTHYQHCSGLLMVWSAIMTPMLADSTLSRASS